MQSTWERVKNKGLAGQLRAQSTVQSRDEGPTEASIFHSFLSSLVTQYKTFTFYIVNKLQKLWEGKGKNKKKKTRQTPSRQQRQRARESERESHLHKTKCFCNCVGYMVVRHINKTSDFSIFLLLWYKYDIDVLE